MSKPDYSYEVINTYVAIPTGETHITKRGEEKPETIGVVHRRLFLTALPSAGPLFGQARNLRVTAKFNKKVGKWSFSITERKERRIPYQGTIIADKYTAMNGPNGKPLGRQDSTEVASFLRSCLGKEQTEYAYLELTQGKPVKLGEAMHILMTRYCYVPSEREEDEE